MTDVTKARTATDLLLGGLMVVAGIVILAHAVVATVVSVLFLGWMLLAAGLVGMVVALFQIGKSGFWTGFLGAALMAVLGLVLLRHTAAAALTLTLVAGAMFLVVGITRLVVAVEVPEQRVALILSGATSAVLGVIVLFNLVGASLTLLGVMLGIQVLVEGIGIMIIGRGARADLLLDDGSRPVAT